MARDADEFIASFHAMSKRKARVPPGTRVIPPKKTGPRKRKKLKRKV